MTSASHGMLLEHHVVYPVAMLHGLDNYNVLFQVKRACAVHVLFSYSCMQTGCISLEGAFIASSTDSVLSLHAQLVETTGIIMERSGRPLT